MKSRSTLFSLLAASLLFAASLAHADHHMMSGSAHMMNGSPDMMSAPPVKAQGNVSYITGGITVDERDAMKPLAKNYNLRMSFSLNVGNYIADVKVKIMSGKKTVLDVVTDGPWLYVKLPVGKYTVMAEYEGKTVKKHASVSAKKGAALSFVWPGVKEVYDE